MKTTKHTSTTHAAISVQLASEDAQAQRFKIPRVLLYLIFLAFLGVNIFEGVLLNVLTPKDPANPSKPKGTTEFNQAICYVLDALMRIGISLAVLLAGGACNFFQPLKEFNKWQWMKLILTRFGIQGAEQLTTLGTMWLSASASSVINQIRIPLVGLLGYLLFCVKLSRDQILYAIAIIPLAVQFNLIPVPEIGEVFEADPKESTTAGYVALLVAVLMMSFANVFVENILKTDFKELKVWNKQFLFACIDLPIMFLLYFISTGIERNLVDNIGTYRPWDPFHPQNWNQWYWVLSLGFNAAMWGVVRLLLLNYADAMWLNITTVFVMGILWLTEYFTGTSDDKVFSTSKLLGLFSLSLILVGYEFATRDADEKKQQSETDENKASA